MKTIKAYCKPKWEIELIDIEPNYGVIMKAPDGEVTYARMFQNLDMADFLFNQLIDKMEGML